jgi:hypothetical protein
VPVKVLPRLPLIDNLPLRLGIGAKDPRLVLRGSGLERIEAITADSSRATRGYAYPTLGMSQPSAFPPLCTSGRGVMAPSVSRTSAPSH